MQQPPITAPQSPGQPKTPAPEQFEAMVAAERDTALANLRAEYAEKAAAVRFRTEQLQAEYRLMGQIATLNNRPAELTPDLCLDFERQLSNLGHDTLFGSVMLGTYARRYGEKLIMGMVCETIQYYTKALKSAHRMDDVEIMQLAAELIIRHRELKYLELVYVLHNGTRGRYGRNYNRIDQEVIWGWFNQYYAESAAWLETKRINERPESTNPILTDPAERRLKELEKKLRAQQEVYRRVVGNG